MAVKWAVANGNWSVGATWNDGVVPAVGDEVYLNGRVVTLGVSTNIGNGTISNGTNPMTGVSGGYLRSANTSSMQTLVANMNAASSYLLYMQGPNITIVGNVLTENGNLINRGSATSLNVTISGNISVGNGSFIANNNGSVSLVINGNVTAQSTLIETTGVSQITINGTASISKNEYVPTLVINSNLFANNGSFCGLNGTVGGNIEYYSTNGSTGFDFAQKTFLNPNFTWKDVTEPRSNSFIIVTDAEMNNRQQYPSENEVKEGVEYVWGEKVGTYQAPPESVVLKDYVYDNGDKVGSLENQNIVGCVTKEDVREGVELIGLQEVGTLVVPDVDDVREGVVFDNGSVGTLIVEGGGDRLRIANFGYYTDSQSDTYIVDINESFKQMFATAEESVLLELFPELDLDNIPDKYFDDLFVKYLKYRLIVEYYRGAGINSVFTPSELTTEVVNYQNVRCEYWLNLANIYLNAWDKKYPNSVKKQRILL
ncbi:MAG: hypothetical protein IIZ94_05315 [Prevotella sp.]|nr:hypothetical protein [Prevotella sp.]